jgi:hypothetical protein
MFDFFPSYSSLTDSDYKITELFKTLYDETISVSPTTFFGLNLLWPRFDLPNRYHRYVISFHTEFLDHYWIVRQAQIVYPKNITLITDFDINPGPAWPDNITFIQQRTIHKQLAIAVERYKYNNKISLPKYKFSSLSFRVSQYKIFATAYMKKHVSANDMILTYHKQYTGPVASWPDGIPALAGLDLDVPATLLNFDDNFTAEKNRPIANADWTTAPYIDALVNLTNESIHYSSTMINGYSVLLPGPYFTEKTFKPLLAGRPFISVSQFESIKELNDLGFDTNFGFSHHYDSDPGDFTRIGKIFETIAQVNAMTNADIFESSIDAVRHNIDHISSGALFERCQTFNQQNKKLLVARST